MVKKYRLCVFVLISMLACRSKDTTTATTPDSVFVLPSMPKDTLPAPERVLWLPDSTCTFLIDSDTHITPANKYPYPREIKLDGNVFLEVPAGQQPLTISTKLLKLSVVGNASFLVMAPAAGEWAEVKVISGNIRVKKAYSSKFNEPDTLRDNQLLMINRSIDLMEKEKLDATDLKAWRARLP